MMLIMYSTWIILKHMDIHMPRAHCFSRSSIYLFDHEIAHTDIAISIINPFVLFKSFAFKCSVMRFSYSA